jgi:hypothetical protein
MAQTILVKVLNLGHWNLFVIWCLEIGALWLIYFFKFFPFQFLNLF